MTNDSANLGPAPASDALLHWLPSPEALVDRCEHEMLKGQPGEALEVLRGLGVPASDFSVTPLGFRAAQLGARSGTAFFHHELRVRLPVPKNLEPEMEVWGEGSVPVWKEGILGEPKYFSFFQDAPFIAFNPNHRRKWPAHELLHGAVGFFWRPDMTRFEAYLGSRLNELLPVVHWHGFDDVFREQCPLHVGNPLYASFCSACEALQAPYWELSKEARTALRPAALRHAEHGLSHFRREWEACLKELKLGRPVATPLGQLDASSDARGYLRGHWNRMTAWSFGTWIELFCEDGVDFHSSVEQLMGRVETVSRELLCMDAPVSLEGYECRRARRIFQDLGYRALMALEGLEEGSAAAEEAEEIVMPLLERGAEECRAILAGGDSTDAVARVLPWVRELVDGVKSAAAHFGEETAASFGALGYRWVETHTGETAELAQLEEGALSLSLSEHAESALRTRIATLYASPILDQRGSLCERLSRLDSADESLHELLAFDAFIQNSPKRDADGEDFAVLPAGMDELRVRGGSLRLNDTIRRKFFTASFLSEQLGEGFIPDDYEVLEAEILAVWFLGEPRLLLLDDNFRALLQVVGTGIDVADIGDEFASSLLNLLGHGVLIWAPYSR